MSILYWEFLLTSSEQTSPASGFVQVLLPAAFEVPTVKKYELASIHTLLDISGNVQLDL